MGYTKKDKILAGIINPGIKDDDDVVVIPSYPDEGYYVAYDGEEYIADTYEDLIKYIVENFPPNSYDIYHIELGEKTYYANFSFQSSKR